MSVTDPDYRNLSIGQTFQYIVVIFGWALVKSMPDNYGRKRQNPFYERGPIRTRHGFYGREKETRQVLKLLEQGQSVAVVGPRYIGKTSMLLHLADMDVQAQYDLVPGKYCFVYADCVSWTDLPENTLYTTMVAKLQDALASSHRDLLSISTESELTAYRVLQDAVRGAAERSLTLVFMLDSFDGLAGNPNLDAGFFSGLLGLANGYGTAFVTACTVPPMALHYANPGTLNSPFFHVLAQIRLPLFDEATAREFLTNNSRVGDSGFSAAEVDFLAQLAGPHPLLLQIAGYHGLEEGIDTGRASQVAWRDRVQTAFLDEAETHWAYQWDSLSPRYKRLLAMLPTAWHGDPDGVRWLGQEAFIAQRSGYPEPVSASFARFVARQPVEGLVQIPPISLDPTERTVLLRGRALSLSPTEFDLLAYLVSSPGQILPREQLEARLWPDERAEHPNFERLRAVVKKLRHALGPDADLVENVRGIGWRFARQASQE